MGAGGGDTLGGAIPSGEGVPCLCKISADRGISHHPILRQTSHPRLPLAGTYPKAGTKDFMKIRGRMIAYPGRHILQRKPGLFGQKPACRLQTYIGKVLQEGDAGFLSEDVAQVAGIGGNRFRYLFQRKILHIMHINILAGGNNSGGTVSLFRGRKGVIPEVQRPLQKAGKGVLVPDGWKLRLIKLENGSIRKADACNQEIGGKRFGENEEADFLLGGKTVFVYAIDIVRYSEIKTDHADGRPQISSLVSSETGSTARTLRHRASW